MVERHEERTFVGTGSWSRGVDGSAERHAIPPSGAKLLAAGFDMPPGA